MNSQDKLMFSTLGPASQPQCRTQNISEASLICTMHLFLKMLTNKYIKKHISTFLQFSYPERVLLGSRRLFWWSPHDCSGIFLGISIPQNWPCLQGFPLCYLQENLITIFHFQKISQIRQSREKQFKFQLLISCQKWSTVCQHQLNFHLLGIN